jgi:FAD/FMN-containing dehydrogenase
MDSYVDYEKRRDRLVEEFAQARKRGLDVGLGKSTSNLFRHRDQKGKKRIDVRRFNHVLSVDTTRMIADVEGMTTYEELVDETLKFGMLPTVVPQLKSITIGGAVSGLGIESSSFKYGLVHETVTEMEILLADGTTVICSPSENKELFYGFPNSYGTLGYVLRLKVRLIPVKRYVKLTHTKFTDAKRYFAHIRRVCAGSRNDARGNSGVNAARYDYIDGVVFGRNEMYMTTGEFVDQLPAGVHAGKYTYMRIFYRSIQEKKIDYVTAKDYIWRWDTDWFWCSKHFGVQNPAVRLLATKWLLNSKTYQRIMRTAHKVLPDAKKTESVIQDVDIPIAHAPEFFDFLLRGIRITPIWICPFQSYDLKVAYDLYALNPEGLYVNFGFWDTIPTTHEDGHYNKLIEAKAFALHGKKGLYSTSFYDEKTFWRIYNKQRYDALKRKYDPDGYLKDLYTKAVKRK